VRFACLIITLESGEWSVSSLPSYAFALAVRRPLPLLYSEHLGTIHTVVYGEGFENLLVLPRALRCSCKTQHYDCGPSECVAWLADGSRLLVEGTFYGGSPHVLFEFTVCYGWDFMHTGVCIVRSRRHIP